MWYLHKEKMYLKEPNSEFRMKLDIQEIYLGRQERWAKDMKTGESYDSPNAAHNLHCLDTTTTAKTCKHLRIH